MSVTGCHKMQVSQSSAKIGQHSTTSAATKLPIRWLLWPHCRQNVTCGQCLLLDVTRCLRLLIDAPWYDWWIWPEWNLYGWLHWFDLIPLDALDVSAYIPCWVRKKVESDVDWQYADGLTDDCLNACTPAGRARKGGKIGRSFLSCFSGAWCEHLFISQSLPKELV